MKLVLKTGKNIVLRIYLRSNYFRERAELKDEFGK
jgi:hypothetical protein